MRASLILAFLFVTGAAFAEERLLGTNADLRTVLTFKVADTVVQKLLPGGWEVSSPASGPAKGSNLTVVLDEELTSFDPDGKAVATFRGVALSVPVKTKEAGVIGALVIGGYFDFGVPGKFGVYTKAEVDIERRARTDSGGKSTIHEIWRIKAVDGTLIDAEIQFARSDPQKRKIESRLFSPIKSDLSILYRIDQASDVIRDATVDRVTKLSFKASGPKLTPLFDGSEQIISVTSVPWYSRQVYSLDP